MASSILQKLIKNHTVTPIISNLRKQILTPPPILSNLSATNPPNSATPNPIPSFTQFPKTHDSNPSQFLNFYPTFSFGDFLNPISSTGFIRSEVEVDVVSDDSNTIWADSVKKKRKKKMNKHKMRKLRKHLRRKT